MASGSTLCRFGAEAAKSPTTNFATFDTRNTRLCLEFDDTTQETAYFEDVMPSTYAGGGVTVRIYWAGDTATTGTVMWGVAFERQADGGLDLDGDSFGSDINSAAVTTNAAAGKLAYTDIVFTDGAPMSSVVANDRFRLRVRRVVASDDMVGDAQIFSVSVRES